MAGKGVSESIQTPAPTSHETNRVLLVEDYVLLADVLQATLRDAGFDVTALVRVADDVIEDHIKRLKPQVVLIDYSSAGKRPATRLIAAATRQGATVAVLTNDMESPELADHLDAGAAGFISVNAPATDMLASLTSLIEGERIISLADRYRLEDARRERRKQQEALRPFEELTRREQQVLVALAEGLSAAEIADANCVALSTVRTQIRAVLTKLNVRSQLAAVSAAQRSGWLANSP